MKEAKKIEISRFKIEQNVIFIEGIILQISNLSQVSIEPIPKKEFRPIVIIVFILGLLGIKQQNDDIKVLGITTILLVIGYVIWLVITNSQEGKYLYIYMNSGNFYYIFCADEEFLRKVIEVLEYCINNRSTQEINIDFGNCKLYNSPLTVGNTNSAVIVGENNSVNINEVDWEMIQDELIKTYEKLPQLSEEYFALKEALNYVLNRDENGFKNVIKNMLEALLQICSVVWQVEFWWN